MANTKISDVLVPGMPDDWDGSALPPDYVENYGKIIPKDDKPEDDPKTI